MVGNIFASLLKLQIEGGRHLPRLMLEKKMSYAERFVFTRVHHSLNHVYNLTNEKDERKKFRFEFTHDAKFMSQVVMRGYYLFKCHGENKIVLTNPETYDTMISPALPSLKNTVDYVGHCSDTFTLVSLVLRDDDDVVEEVWVLVFNAENPQWKKVDTTNLRTLKIRSPNERCILIDDQILFSAHLYLDNQTIDINGQEDVVVSFGLIYHNFKLYGLPTAMVSFRHKSLVKLQGDLAAVVYNNLRTEPFEIWRRETTWYKWKTCRIEASIWERNEESPNDYYVSLATSKGVLVFTPTTVPQTMRPNKPVYAFMYDPCKDKVVFALDISWTKLKRNSPILTAVDYEGHLF